MCYFTESGSQTPWVGFCVVRSCVEDTRFAFGTFASVHSVGDGTEVWFCVLCVLCVLWVLTFRVVLRC